MNIHPGDGGGSKIAKCEGVEVMIQPETSQQITTVIDEIEILEKARSAV